MPELKLVKQTTSEPIVLASICGSGPVMALDLATVAHPVLANIAACALAVVADWGSGNITTDSWGTEETLDALTTATDVLDALYTETVPSREVLVEIGLTTTLDDAGYPVIRDGSICLIKATDLTAVEKVAVRLWLDFNTKAATESAASFKARLDQFEQEVA